MSDVEQRLLRAARELRELDLAPPPLPGVDTPANPAASRLPALVMPVLVLLGGLAVMAGALGRDAGTDPVAEQAVAVIATSGPASPAVETPVSLVPDAAVEVPLDAAAPVAQRVRVLTAHEEVVMIGALAPSRQPAADAVTVTSLRRF